jgi:hypothetical protein
VLAQRVEFDLRPIRFDGAQLGRVLHQHGGRVHAVLVLQAVRHHFKLKLAHGAEQKHGAGHRAEDLDGAFFTQLRQARLELLAAQRVGHFNAAKHLRHDEEQAIGRGLERGRTSQDIQAVAIDLRCRCQADGVELPLQGLREQLSRADEVDVKFEARGSPPLVTVARPGPGPTRD